MSDATNTEEFDWGAKGEGWWREQAKSCGVDGEMAIRFCAAKSRGLTNTRAAKEAGAAEPHKSAGYRLARTRGVELLMTAVSVESGGAVGLVTAAEGKAILSSLARGSDPSIRIRSVELLAKIEAQERESATPPELDGLSRERLVRDLILWFGDHGAVAAMMMRRACYSSPALSCLPMFHDIIPRVLRFAPELVERDLARHSQPMKADYAKVLADAEWQLDTRKQVWSEIGWRIVNNEARAPLIEKTNGAAKQEPEVAG
jgi:hypothetical protein